MNLRRLNAASLTLGLICVAQFFTLPYLGDVSRGAKAFLIAFVVLGLALALFKSSSVFRVSRAYLSLGPLWCVLFASAWNASSSYDAFIYTAFFAVGLLFLAMVTHMAATEPLFATRLVDGLLLLGVLVAALGLYEYVTFVTLGPTQRTLIPWLLPANTSYRVYGTYGQPNIFALFLTVSLLGFVHRYLHSPFDFSRPKWRALRFVPLFLVSLAFFLTFSRAGLLSFSLVIGFLAWLTASGRYLEGDPQGRKEFLRLLFSLTAAFLMFKGLSWVGPAASDEARNFAGVSIGTEGRFVFWTSSLLMFLDHPFLGVGLNNFRYYLPEYAVKAHELLGFVQYEAMAYTDWSHNEFLQILCEGGVLACALLLVLLVMFFRLFWLQFIIRNKPYLPFFLYSHLFLLPFLIQACFEWPLRHPALLILFFALLGVLLAQYPVRTFSLSAGGRKIYVLLFFAATAATAMLFHQELRIGTFFYDIKQAERPEETFPDFVDLSRNPYSEFRTLKKAIPIYVNHASQNQDVALAERLLPYARRLIQLQGAYWQWYNLAIAYGQLGEFEKAREAIEKAIDLQPTHNLSWQFLHYLNMLKAAEDTGRPLEDFTPRNDHSGYQILESFHVRNKPAGGK